MPFVVRVYYHDMVIVRRTYPVYVTRVHIRSYVTYYYVTAGLEYTVRSLTSDKKLNYNIITIVHNRNLRSLPVL